VLCCSIWRAWSHTCSASAGASLPLLLKGALQLVVLRRELVAEILTLLLELCRQALKGSVGFSGMLF